MMIENIHRVSFLGIGGIGMSALARYFKSLGKEVSGYDHTSTNLTDMLISEGIDIHFEDNISLIPKEFKNNLNTLIIYTPAIPVSNSELHFFRENKFELFKRSQVLGEILKEHKSIAIAGTHGKTTISSMIAHIFTESGKSCNAFLGGIAKNFNSNLVINKNPDFFIAEADEFDRSFLTLFPDYAVVSSMDDDHLDVYGDRENLIKSFEKFVSQVKAGGILILKSGLEINIPPHIKVHRYALTGPGDYYAYEVKPEGIFYNFSIHTPLGDFHEIKTGVPGSLNVENFVAAFAIAQQSGINEKLIIDAIRSFRGVLRRFDIKLNDGKTLYIDDYAHHPQELKAFIGSVKESFPDKQITGIFQPHLFSRTRDFSAGFAESLSMMDNVILLEIYPAREAPIPGVSSGLIFDDLKNKGRKIECKKEQLFKVIEELKPEILLSMGAGDIDLMVEPLKDFLIQINK